MKKEIKNTETKTTHSYELKQEYLDDLTAKLNAQRPSVLSKWKYASGTLLILLLTIGTCYFIPKKEGNTTRISVNSMLTENEYLQIEKNENHSKNILPGDKNRISLLTESNATEAGKVGLQSNSEESHRNKSVNNKGENVIKLRKHSASKESVNKTVSSGLLSPDLKEESNSMELKKKGIDGKEISLAKIPAKVDTFVNTDNESTINSEIKNSSSDSVIQINKIKEAANKQEEKNNISDEIFENKEKEITENRENNIDKNQSEDSIKTKVKDSIITQFIDSVNTMKLDSNQTKLKWGVAILGGPSFNFSRLSNSPNNSYQQKRIKEENMLVNASVGLQIERYFSDNWKLTSGMSFVQYGSNNTYTPVDQNEQVSQFSGFDTTLIPKVDSMFYAPSRTWYTFVTERDTSIDSTFNPVNTTSKDSVGFLNRGKVTFSYFEIPIMLGYVKTFNNLEFGINSGVSLGVLSQSSGYFINEDLVTVHQAQSRKLIVNFLLSPEIVYTTKSNIYVGIQPALRLGLNNLSIKEPIDRRYYSIQMNAKIGIRF